jgi:hypothetical protein
VQGGNADLIVRQSSFASTGEGQAIVAPECVRIANGFSVDLLGNTFSGFATAVTIGAQCVRPTRIVHDTFHANRVAIDYQGGTEHVLRNSIFTAQQVEAVRGCDSPAITFAAGQRQDHLLYGNNSIGCIASDPGIVMANPLYVSSVNRDFRLRYGSPAIDAAPTVAVDVNGPAPNDYLGSGPDFGGCETY